MVNEINKTFEDLRKGGHRITKGRKKLLEILHDEHLTFKEIKERMAYCGHTNVASIYNTIDFLIESGLIIEVNIAGTKYYESIYSNQMHGANNYIHLKLRDSDKIVEINNPEIFEGIEKLINYDDSLDIFSIQLVIEAKEKEN